MAGNAEMQKIGFSESTANAKGVEIVPAFAISPAEIPGRTQPPTISEHPSQHQMPHRTAK